MLLEPQDVALYFKLQQALFIFVNRHLKVVPAHMTTPETVSELLPETRLKIRDALLAKLELLQSFVDENSFHLPEEELAIVQSWKHLVAGRFYIFQELKKYTVFLTTDNDPVAYGVLALSEPFEDMIGPNLPILVRTVLLPFKGVIIYDGLLNAFQISFGPGIRRSLKEGYKEAKERQGIITSLPFSGQAPKAKPLPKLKPKAKDATAGVLSTITGLTDRFCREHLNDEYGELCRKLAEKLARKRPSPLLSGHANTWASGIVRTIGWVNFLHDKTQTPHMPLRDIDAHFGISESTGAAKLATIRKLLRIHHLEPAWSLPSRLDDNPLVWMLKRMGL